MKLDGCRVSGRGIRKGCAMASADHNGVCLRIDDEANPEFWLDLSLSRADLVALLAAVDAERAEAEVMP